MSKRDKEWERFRVIRQLGAGAFGRTLLVTDTAKNDREVVIKVPHDKKTEEALINDLMNAAALTAALVGMTHPNIVRCLGFGKFETYYVMILEYVDGRDLRKMIGPIQLVRPPMEIKLALGIFDNVCSGLVTAHKINLLHRDIKPDNILVRDEDGVAKLADFGISTIVQSSSVGSGTVAGTFPYMAPEALAGRASFQSDIWALSVTMYETLTGRLPFWDENLFALKQKIDTEDPAAPRGLNPAIDARLNALILKGLEKDPARRFRSAQEMLDALGPDVEEEITALRRKFQAGTEDEAERQARQLLERMPHEPRLYMLIGEFCNRRQQFLQAERVVRQGIAACPDHADLHFYLAPALWFQGGKKRKQAIETMERAIEFGLSPSHEKQARNLLNSWRAMGGRS
jgi:serine/threonine protein kinase